MNEFNTHDAYPVRLRDGRKATLTLPVGLTTDDCARIIALVAFIAKCAAEDRVSDTAIMPLATKGPTDE